MVIGETLGRKGDAMRVVGRGWGGYKYWGCAAFPYRGMCPLCVGESPQGHPLMPVNIPL